MILLQIERGDAIDVIIGNLQHVIALAQLGRVNPIHHSLVVMKVFQRLSRNAQLLQNVFFHCEHRMVVRVDGVQFFVRKLTGIRDPVDVHVKKRHEDSNHQALRLKVLVSQRVL